MNTVMKIAVLAALLCVDAWLLLSRKRTPRGRSGNHTVIIPAMYLDMLDPGNLNKVIGTYSLPKDRLVNTGLIIARSAEDAEGDVLLECLHDKTRTVRSKNHAVVAMDEYGCFIQNIDANGMYLLVDGNAVPKDEIAISEDKIIYLGEQPVRFRYHKIEVPGQGGRGNKGNQAFRRIMGAIQGYSGKKKRRTGGGNW